MSPCFIYFFLARRLASAQSNVLLSTFVLFAYLLVGLSARDHLQGFVCLMQPTLFLHLDLQLYFNSSEGGINLSSTRSTLAPPLSDSRLAAERDVIFDKLDGSITTASLAITSLIDSVRWSRHIRVHTIIKS